jgi:hypothetical protein
MNRTRWKFGIGLLWLGLPLIAFRYWMVWDRLPANMATHFNAANQPNGWMTPEASMLFILGLYAFLALLFTVITVVVYKVHAPDVAAWAILGLFYVILGVIYYGNEAVLAYNLDGKPVEMLPLIAPVFAAISAAIVITLTSKRGRTLPAGTVLAEEVHAGRAFALILFSPVIIELAVIYAIPNTGLRITFALIALILIFAGLMAWTGFTYVFTSSGVEIRTLGFRLRSIPAKQIKEYASGRWNIVGGYGVRGIGERRAYVWGNRGVRIKTEDGEVFMGHKNPDQIIHDLDAVMQCGAGSLAR